MVNHDGPSIPLPTHSPAGAQGEHWHIVGAGAMGCLWAARLWLESRSPVPTDSRRMAPILLLRDTEAVRRYRRLGGLTLESETTLIRCTVPAISMQENRAPLTHILLTTKAQDAPAALAGMESCLTPATTLVLVQNGVKMHREIAQRYPELQVFSAVTSHGAYLRAPYHVVHAGIGEVWLGQLDVAAGQLKEGQSRARLAPTGQFTQPLPDTMNIHYDADIESRLWRKFAINCAVNVLTVLYDCRNGELLTLPAAYRELQALCSEIEYLFSIIPGTPPLSGLLSQVEAVLTTTALNYSSMLQDVRRGKPTEVLHLNHYLCELAHNLGVACPVNEDVLRRFAAYSNPETR